jgi:hypothetical protein
MVKGHVVHALRLDNGTRTEGISALEGLSVWREGTYYRQTNELPPARTIRLGTEKILGSLWRVSCNRPERSCRAGSGDRAKVLDQRRDTTWAGNR